MEPGLAHGSGLALCDSNEGGTWPTREVASWPVAAEELAILSDREPLPLRWTCPIVNPYPCAGRTERIDLDGPEPGCLTPKEMLAVHCTYPARQGPYGLIEAVALVDRHQGPSKLIKIFQDIRSNL